MTMKIKKLISFSLIIVILVGVFSSAFSSSALSATKKSMLQYTSLNLTFAKPESESYKCTVSNNKNNYIKVDAYNEGAYYWLMLRSNKATPSNSKPLITVYKEQDGQKIEIKKYQISVNPAKKVAMSNMALNLNTSVRIAVKNPYEKIYRYEYNKKIIRMKTQFYAGGKEYPVVKGLKKGKTSVKAYIAGTKTLIGTFTVYVGNYKASVKKDYKVKTIYFNSHIDSRAFGKAKLNLSNAISHYHANAVYSVTSSNPKLIGVTGVAKTEITPKSVCVYSKATGSAVLTVYEKCGKAKSKKIGTIKITVKKSKDSDVYAAYRERDNDGIFYENFISPGESFDLKSAVIKRYLNPGNAKYHFKPSEYTFTATSNRPDVVSVDENGVCHCHDLDKDYPAHYITYKIKFKDGSGVTGGGQFDIVDAEEFYNY